MVKEFRQANYYWVVLSGIMLLLAHVSRSYRWNLLLHPLGYRPKLFHILVSSALLLYGWNQQEGLILATFIWASQTLLTLVVGGICFVISLFVSKPLCYKFVESEVV